MTSREGAAFAVLAIWGVLYLATIFRSDFTVPEGVLPVALLAATYLFTGEAVKKALRDGKDKP